jgi:hypothetical protein
MIGVKASYWKGSWLGLLKRIRATVLEIWGESNRRSAKYAVYELVQARFFLDFSSLKPKERLV